MQSSMRRTGRRRVVSALIAFAVMLCCFASLSLTQAQGENDTVKTATGLSVSGGQEDVDFRVDTGSKMDDVVYEEFKGTGNMELILDRKLQEKRVFPAIDIVKSGTRREDLLLSQEEQEAVDIMRKALNGMKSDEATENILNMFAKTRDNREFVQMIIKQRIV